MCLFEFDYIGTGIQFINWRYSLAGEFEHSSMCSETSGTPAEDINR